GQIVARVYRHPRRLLRWLALTAALKVHDLRDYTWRQGRKGILRGRNQEQRGGRAAECRW
ncbi:MAG TPA: hypothetical protein VHI75_11890, partial [Casimicrobiaceae bacterium]|nr:hypothetical protein [Casimicrobiaceae bacterium]